MTHWYDLETGSPCHTIIGKNGKERARNIKDAREYRNVPGVTSIIGRLDKPFLHHWRNNQILDAVLNMESKLRPALKLTEPDKWKAIILEEADKARKKAETEGRRIHSDLEQYIITGKYSEEGYEWTFPVIEALDKELGKRDYFAEKTFAGALGYGGSIDLISLEDPVIIDFKGKADKFFIQPKVSLEHSMQLAAYKYAMFGNSDVPCYNLYISYETPGKIFLLKWSKETIERSWKMFKHLLEFWKLENDFYV